MTKKHSIVKAGVWQTINMVLFTAIQLAYYGYMARVLPKSDFGLIALANVFISLATTVSEMGLGPALIQKRNLERGHLSAAFMSNIVISLFFFSCIFFLAQPLSVFFNNTRFELVLKVLSLNFVLRAFGLVSDNLLQKELKFKHIFFIETGSNLIASVIGILLLIRGYGIWALVFGSLILTGLKSIGFIVANRGRSIPFFQFKRTHVLDLLHFGMGMSLIRLNNYMVNAGFIFLLGKLVTMTSLGVFERSFKIMNLPGHYLGQVVDKVMFPGMARVNDDNKKLFHYFEYGLSLVNSLMIPFSALLILYTREIILVLLGSKWLDAVWPLRILFLSIPFRISVRMCDSVIRAKGEVYKSAKRKFLYTAVLLIAIALGNIGGLIGIVSGVTLAAIFNYFNMIFLVKHIFAKKAMALYQPFIEAMRFSLLVIFPISIVYTLLNVLWGRLEFFSMAISLALLFVILYYIYRHKREWFGEGVNWLFEQLKSPYKGKSSPV